MLNQWFNYFIVYCQNFDFLQNFELNYPSINKNYFIYLFYNQMQLFIYLN